MKNHYNSLNYIALHKIHLELAAHQSFFTLLKLYNALKIVPQVENKFA